MLATFLRFIPGGAFIAPIIEGVVRAFIAIISTPIGAAALALMIGIWWGGNRGEERARLQCEAEKRESIEAARRDDQKAADEALAKMRDDQSKLIQLRDQDNAEDAAQIAELQAEIAAGRRSRCDPTDADARRLRLK